MQAGIGWIGQDLRLLTELGVGVEGGLSDAMGKRKDRLCGGGVWTLRALIAAANQAVHCARYEGVGAQGAVAMSVDEGGPLGWRQATAAPSRQRTVAMICVRRSQSGQMPTASSSALGVMYTADEK